MKSFALSMLIFCFALSGYTQNAKIDSLNILISKATTDTGRIWLLVKKSIAYTNVNLDSSIAICLKNLEGIKKYNLYGAEIDTRQRLIINYCYKGDFKAASEQVSYLSQFIKPSKDSADFADLYSNTGMLLGMQSKYDSSINFYEKALRIFLANNNKERLAGTYSNLGIGYQQQSNFSRALYYQQKALSIAEEQKDLINQAYTLTNIGNTYENIGDTAKAEQVYLQAIKIAKENSLNNVELYNYSNLAVLYNAQGKWQKSYDFSTKAAALGESLGDQGIQAASLSKASVALANMRQWQGAESLSKKAIVLADAAAQPLNIFQAYTSMGAVLRLQEKWKEAIPFFEKGFSSIEETDMYTDATGKLYKELSECYEKTGKYVRALDTYKKAAVISDSVRSNNNIRKTTQLSMSFEFEKKEQLQKAEQKAKDDIANAKQLALIIGLGLTLVLAFVAFIGFRNKQKANAALKKSTAEIENAMTQLKATQSQLIQSEKMASLGELTAGIAHEIQNPLNFVNNFSELNTELVEELNELIEKQNWQDAKAIANDIRQNEEKINHHGKRAEAIVKGMLQHSRTSNGVKEPTNINALADEYLRLSYHGLRAKDKNFNAEIITDFNETIGSILLIPQDIGRVLLNLYNNAFYAVGEKKKQQPESFTPTVSVSTKKIGNKIEIKVRDNGNGIPQKIVDKIFQPFFTTKPTGQGTGLGLSLSYDIVKAHNGEIKVESKEGEGSTFIMQFPVG